MEKCSEMHKQPWESVWLINVMADEHYGIPRAYVLSNGNLAVKGNVMYLPIYMLMFIQKHPAVKKQIYHFDLSNL